MHPSLSYYTKFDIFSGGLIGISITILIIYFFSLSIVTNKVKNPYEKALELTTPPY